MRHPSSVWKATGLVSLVAFFVYAIMHAGQFLAGDFRDLLVHSLTVAGACGWATAALVTFRNRAVSGRASHHRRSAAL